MGDMADRDGRHGEVMFDVFEPTAYCPGGIWGSYHLGTVHVKADIFRLDQVSFSNPLAASEAGNLSIFDHGKMSTKP